MANNYDITMKEYNGTDYDNLYPQTIGQQVLLNSNTIKLLLGITEDNPSINDALRILADGSQSIEIGSYTGDGNYGSSNPNSISFANFNPRFVIITGSNTAFFVRNVSNNKGCLVHFSSVSQFPTATWGNKTLSWYSSSAMDQLNDSGTTFNFIAFS